MSDAINSVIDRVREQYMIWSNDLPFAQTHTDKLFSPDIISDTFPIPVNVIRPEMITVDGVDEKIVDKLKQLETRDFLKMIDKSSTDHQFKSKKENLLSILETACEKLFADVGYPDFIIWSRGMFAEYIRQARTIKPRICDGVIRQFIVESKFDDIYLGMRENYDKIYPNENRIIINSIEDPHGVSSTKIKVSIRHKVMIYDNDSLARITIG